MEYKLSTCNQLSIIIFDDIYLKTKLLRNNLLKVNDIINII